MKRSLWKLMWGGLAAALLLCPMAAPAQQTPRKLSDAEVKQIREAVPEKATAQPAKARKVLVFWRCEGFFHSDGIAAGNECFRAMADKTKAFEVTVSDDMAQFDPERLNQYDAVIFNSTTGLKFEDPARRKALLDFVNNGKGVVGIHGAADNFPTWPEGIEMIGGLFDGHPWTAGGTWAVKIDDPKHLLNKAFAGQGFKIRDEIYQVKAPYTREKLHVLLSLDLTDPETGKVNGMNRADRDFAISWIRNYGKGRVFYGSMGHNTEVFWNKPVVRHYLDCIQWALGDLKADARPNGPAVRPAGLPAPEPNEADRKLFTDVQSYDFDKDREALTAVERRFREAAPADQEALEAGLAGVLKAPASTFAAKQFACRTLRQWGTKRSVPALAELLPQDIAIFALENMGCDEAGEALRNALKTAKPEEQPGLLAALAARRDPKAVPAAAKLAVSDNAPAAHAAIETLGRIGTEKAADALADAAGALKARPELDAVRVEALLKAAELLRAEGSPRAAAKIFEGLTADAAQPLRVQMAAWRGLAQAKPGKSAEIALALFKNPDLRMVRLAGKILQESKEKDTVRACLAKMDELSGDAQLAVLGAVADGQRRDLEALVLALAEKAPDAIRQEVFQTLSVVGGAASVPALAKMSYGEARSALEKMQGPGVEEAIRKLAREGEPAARSKMLGVVAARRAEGVAPLLLEATKDQNAEIRLEAAKSLGQLGGPEQIAPLVDLVCKAAADNEREVFQQALLVVCKRKDNGARGTEAILGALAGASVPAKGKLLETLGPLGDAKALPVLTAAVKDKEPAVLDGAVRGLTNWPDAAPADTLLDVARNAQSVTHRVLALRAFLDMIDKAPKSDAEKVKMYADALAAAQRGEDKGTVLDAAAKGKTLVSLEAVEKFRSDSIVGARARKILVDLFNETSYGKDRRDRWRAEASVEGGRANDSKDGNRDSRWSTGTGQKSGQWLRIELPDEGDVAGVILDCRKAAEDYPRSFNVFVSKNGNDWGPAAVSGKGSGPLTVATFPAKAGKFVKIELTGDWEKNHWSVDEIGVFRTAEETQSLERAAQAQDGK